MNVIGRRLLKQAVVSGKAMLAQASLEIANARFIFAGVLRGRAQLEPDGVEPQPAQSQHPLQRHGKIAAAFRIFRRKPAAEKDRHRRRIVRPRFSSNYSGSIKFGAGWRQPKDPCDADTG